MIDVSFHLNPQSSPHIFLAGNEQTPVIVIDDFAADTRDVIRDAAESADFIPDSTYYPGLRARPAQSYRQEIVRAIVPLLAKVYSIPTDRSISVKGFYSLIATPPERLQLLQRVPHFDSNKRYHFAITHYLNPGEHGGTGLFRHRPTGFEKITEDRLGEYGERADAFVKAHGEPPAAYITASDDHFELYASIEYRPNRLVAYPGSLLHSGLIDPARDISSDPAGGRLTANFFFEFQ